MAEPDLAEEATEPAFFISAPRGVPRPGFGDAAPESFLLLPPEPMRCVLSASSMLACATRHTQTAQTVHS